MRIRGAKQVHYDSGPNMTPLVDVVMVILIFLMLAGSFAGAEHFLVSNVPYTPKGAGGQPPPAGFVPDEEIPITFVGLRPGEKLFEELVGAGETAEPSSVQKIMRIRDASRCDPQILESQINRLVGVAVHGDTSGVIRQLRTMIPSFEPPDPPAAAVAFSEPGQTRRSERTWRARSRRARRRPRRRFGAHGQTPSSPAGDRA